jgi:hypothetical protein
MLAFTAILNSTQIECELQGHSRLEPRRPWTSTEMRGLSPLCYLGSGTPCFTGQEACRSACAAASSMPPCGGLRALASACPKAQTLAFPVTTICSKCERILKPVNEDLSLPSLKLILLRLVPGRFLLTKR